MKNNLPLATEHQIQTDIIRYLKLKGYYVQRLNSGTIPIGEGRARRMIRLAEVGTPDLMAFRIFQEKDGSWYTKLVFIEVKRPGNKPTIHQEQKMLELMSYGAKCIIAFSVADVEKQIS